MELAQLHVSSCARQIKARQRGEDGEMVLALQAQLKDRFSARQRADRTGRCGECRARLIEHAPHSLALFDLFFGKDSEYEMSLMSCDPLQPTPCGLPQSTETTNVHRHLEGCAAFAASIELRRQIEEHRHAFRQSPSKTEPVYVLLKAIQDSKSTRASSHDRFRREVVPHSRVSLVVRLARSPQRFQFHAIVLRGISRRLEHRIRYSRGCCERNGYQACMRAELKQRLAEDRAALQQMRPWLILPNLLSSLPEHCEWDWF